MEFNIKQKINDFSALLTNKYYREFILLFVKYGKKPRYEKGTIRFLDFEIDVHDYLSFIFQYKEIFVKKAYAFATNKNEPIIFDCGANIGTSCLYFKKIFPYAKIKAFEADPNLAATLKINLSKNSAEDVEVIPKAVWINNDGVLFGPDGADGGSMFNEKNKNRIDSIRLKDFLEKESEVDMLKMDIEGAEVDVLSDCSGSLENVRNIYVEYHRWRLQPFRLDELLTVLTKEGFSYYLEPLSKILTPLAASNNLKNSDLQFNIYASK